MNTRALARVFIFERLLGRKALIVSKLAPDHASLKSLTVIERPSFSTNEKSVFVLQTSAMQYALVFDVSSRCSSVFCLKLNIHHARSSVVTSRSSTISRVA